MPRRALDYFLHYVTFDTQADERSSSCPSTPGQLVLQQQIASDLRALGLADVTIDEHGYLMATVPATTPRSDVPVIGLIAHVDTSPEMSGAGVKPLVHAGYDGRDLVLPDGPDVVLRAADNPDLAACLGHDIVTASGTTLLGADDKAGVAEIVAAADFLVAHPDISHGVIRVAFTPDEEIGRGTDRFDVARFGAACAYTLDGGTRGEFEIESFSANAMTVVFHGFNIHPGYARARMVNAIKVAADFLTRLPADRLSPETTAGHEGFVHPYVVEASVERTSVRLLLRDFDTARLDDEARLVESLAREAVAAHPGSSFDTRIEESYRNMKQILDGHPRVVRRAVEALRRAGLEPRMPPIRGGTDGSRLSFMGLPTPNLFAGEHNFHSRLEWVSAQDMDKAVEVIVELAKAWAE